MALIDREAYSTLGYLYYPNWDIAVILLLLTPLSVVLSVELSVIASARVSDVRAASQLGTLMFLPFVGLYIAGEIGLISLDINNLLIISAVLVALDLVFFRISTATFRREEILTKVEVTYPSRREEEPGPIQFFRVWALNLSGPADPARVVTL